ncbi:MAG: hypothetical protein EOO04_27930 [Chitinophagaceae bacterium]|nr:MAG: hypothetical protein EOO04_27930 [Chitinophagaceae bacterium]
MRRQTHIRSFSAVLMMLVMAFSITPKRTLHEIFGCHDKANTTYQHYNGKEASLHKDGFHCACEQTEFQTPFLSTVPPAFDNPIISFEDPANIGLTVSLHSIEKSLQFLRGPPAFV